VTGASSGIGAAIARKLAQQGMHVLLVARRAERLELLASAISDSGGKASALPADLTCERERGELPGRVGEVTAGLDVLINNAGLGWYGHFEDMSWPTALQMLQVNITAVVQLTSLLLPQMKEKGSGHIINIGSIAGSIPSQGVALYSGTKAFLDAFTTALHRELQGSGVHASVVRAGPVESEFYEAASGRPGGMTVPARRFAVPSQRVADRVWRLLSHPRRVVYVPWFLVAVPWLEVTFGWLMDLLGPLLLQRAADRT
jgi:short-subunit dehydrogenase